MLSFMVPLAKLLNGILDLNYLNYTQANLANVLLHRLTNTLPLGDNPETTDISKISEQDLRDIEADTFWLVTPLPS